MNVFTKFEYQIYVEVYKIPYVSIFLNNSKHVYVSVCN